MARNFIHADSDHTAILAVVRAGKFDNLTIGVLMDKMDESVRTEDEREAVKKLRERYEDFEKSTAYWRNPELDISRKKKARWELVAEWRRFIWKEIAKAHGLKWKRKILRFYNEANVFKNS